MFHSAADQNLVPAWIGVRDDFVRINKDEDEAMSDDLSTKSKTLSDLKAKRHQM